MEVYRFPVLVWKDSAGFYTASLADAEGVVEVLVPVVGYGETPQAALSQIKDYVNWHYKKNPWYGGPTVISSKLVHYKVKVRPEYRVEGKIYPYERNLTLKVSVVDCLHEGGIRSAVIPRLSVEFFYSQGQLRDLVAHYVQEKMSGLPPRVISRYLPPQEVFLETITAKSANTEYKESSEADIEFLKVVAEPLGTKTFKARYSRPFHRDATVAELVKRLSGRGSNVLLVGERGCGKTSVLLEAVRKLEKRIKGDERYSRRYWMTRGARIIAGMRYLGQWEERMEMVVEELANIEGVLCLENLQEMIQTGGRGPEDSVAAFLTPYMERGEMVLVAEATPQELDACRRLLPGFVDLFSVLPLPKFDSSVALEVLSEVVQQLDRRFRTEAAPEVVGECFRLHKRFLPYHAFPGKASQFLSQLYDEKKRDSGRVDRTAVVTRFSRETGLPLNLLRDEDPLPLSDIQEYFRERVVGQDTACQEVSDLVSTFKAGLNDPERPLGVLLFCGPTGVGKTEMAKTISKCFFGAGSAAERLVRLDMSEYGGYGAARRLLGDKDRPGELIRRVRQQPFTVVLFDEIEKAHPDIFDLLLGVFDEGRLTDPWGRVTTFRSTVIIMTSNLGVSALRPIGIHQSKAPSYTAEIMNFFRPEFFNRIDSVVSFDPLKPEDIVKITSMELRALCEREGLQRRGLSLRWTEAVVEHLANLGYDARYGARPLKRAIEQKVVVPLARYLVEHPELRDCPIDVELSDQEIVLG